jgi:hypothetical protein
MSGLCSHFFNRPTLVLGFHQLVHNKKCILLEGAAAAAGSILSLWLWGQKFVRWAVIRKEGENHCRRLSWWFLGPITVVPTKTNPNIKTHKVNSTIGLTQQ